MIEEKLIDDARVLSRWEKHKFMVMVGLTILISLFLVMVSLQLYSSSGAAQLDLSRPGYQSVREEASRKVDFIGFPDSGQLDKEALDTFIRLYDEQVKKATEVDSYGGDVLSDTALGLGAPTTQ